MSGLTSFMTPAGYLSDSCGYCKSEDNSSSKYYAFSNGVHPFHYQGLVDRGWRRSGTTYYKPDVRNGCCPHYTIRLDASRFTPNQEQRKAANKFAKYIIGEDYVQKAARLCPRTREQTRLRKTHFELCERMHEPEYQDMKQPIDPKDGKMIEPAHKLEITLEPDIYTEEKYALFANYQRTVHRQPPSRITKRGFRSFLCSGLRQEMYTTDGKERKIGSYHHCYRIDGRLVAMGVLDLLPNCVSSVYLLYHQDFSEWKFGKLSAMQEIALAIEGGYGFYYMGYYIHDCVKMKYKRAFHPTYVLDPEAYSWDLFDANLLSCISAKRYVSLSQERLSSTNNSANPTHEQLAQGSDDVSPKEGRPEHLFESSMPGILQPEEILGLVPFAEVKVKIEEEVIHLPHIEWDLEEMRNPAGVQGIIAEFIACIGPELAKEIGVVLR